jgi:hypothetical protein
VEGELEGVDGALENLISNGEGGGKTFVVSI